jgi:hypothetical protein
MQCESFHMIQRDAQITLRVAGELRAILEAEAAACGRSLSKLIRSILTEHAANSVASGGVEIPMRKVA